MAIYQYYLAIVPKHGILKKYNLIPNEIRINTETGYFESDADFLNNPINFLENLDNKSK